MIGSNNTITTNRRTVSLTGKELPAVSDTLTDVPVYLEQISPDEALALDGSFTYDMYRIHADGIIDIDEGDKATDKNGKIYIVKGVQFFPGEEIPSHTEAILYKEDEKKNEN